MVEQLSAITWTERMEILVWLFLHLPKNNLCMVHVL